MDGCISLWVLYREHLYLPAIQYVIISPPATLPQGLKRSEQSAMMELFRTKLLADGGADSAHTGGSDKRIQPIKRLEKLMRF